MQLTERNPLRGLTPIFFKNQLKFVFFLIQTIQIFHTRKFSYYNRDFIIMNYESFDEQVYLV